MSWIGELKDHLDAEDTDWDTVGDILKRIRSDRDFCVGITMVAAELQRSGDCAVPQKQVYDKIKADRPDWVVPEDSVRHHGGPYPDKGSIQLCPSWQFAMYLEPNGKWRPCMCPPPAQ